MKSRSVLAAVLVLGIGVVGCSDDDADSDPAEQLYGGWITGGDQVYVEFNEDGTWTAAESEGVDPFDSGTYSFDGTTLTQQSGEESMVCAAGDTGVVEITFIDADSFSVAVIEDDCERRTAEDGTVTVRADT